MKHLKRLFMLAACLVLLTGVISTVQAAQSQGFVTCSQVFPGDCDQGGCIPSGSAHDCSMACTDGTNPCKHRRPGQD